MSKIKIEFNSAGFRNLLFSDGVKNLVQNTTNNIASKANANSGGGFEARVQKGGYGGGRYIGFVTSTDPSAARAEAEDKALTRAIS